jgi:AhpD family alkylhydroperoxidase
MPERTVPRPTLFRLVLIPLGLVQLVDGVWALFFPRSFYDDFPPGRGGWVSALPGYSEHLVTDVGALFLATGVLLIVAGLRLERTLVAVTLGVWLLWAVPHTVWHLLNLDAYDTADAVSNTIALALTVLGPVGLLGLLARSGRPADRATAAPGDVAMRLRGVQRSRNPVVGYAFRESRKKFGRVPAPVAAFAHSPGLLAGWGMLELATERAKSVGPRIKYLATMKTAALSGCEWCLDFGSEEARANGVSDDDLRELVRHRESDRFTEVEKLVLDYAAGTTRTPVDVPDELFDRLREHFDEEQIVELTSLIALENYRARFNWALGISGEGYSEGAYCVRPEPAGAGAAAGG